jgi:hypothetical protein
MKYLKGFITFLNEQDMGMDMGDPNATGAAAPKPDKYKFIFIEDGEVGNHKYPDGTTSKKYTSYQISKDNLDKWLSSNIISTKELELSDAVIDVKKKSISKYISGEKSILPPDSKGLIDKFRKQVIGDQIGEKLNDIDVTFYDSKTYGCEEVEITFVIIPKK